DMVLAGNAATSLTRDRFITLASDKSEPYAPETGPTYFSYIERAYRATDEAACALWNEMPDAHIIVASDHGFHSTWMAINANLVLETLGLYDPADPASSPAVAYGAGGMAQVYINLAGRNPDGVVAEEDYEQLREQI